MPVMVAERLAVSDEERAALERMAVSSSLPHRTVLQARGLLLAADGVANNEIARRCDTTADTVRRWRAKFEGGGVEAVGRIAPGRGRKPELGEEVVEAIVHDTLHTRPDDATHWSSRALAAKHGVGKDTVARIWQARRLKPWKVDTFKLSNDPAFEAKLVDIVGLYVDPPERAVVLCFDEKSQCQALERSQPSLPLKPGRAGTMTHDYKRHGTTTLFAALNTATGTVVNHCFARHRHREFLAFLKIIDGQVPRDLEIHLVLDNYATHKHPAVREWLAKPPQRRWHLHFTPTSASWLNLVERWFKELTDKRLRRDSFTSVDQLIDTIDEWAETWNANPRPYTWHKTTHEILAKVRRARTALDHQIKSATDH
jgi:transposase